ncbi:MAG: hypothetical protein N2380_02485 [bacterium]|nr:hypothetical protein [bacterium]
MIRKLIVLIILGVFLVGAFGGCYTYEIPDLSGNWNGKLDSVKFLGVNITITIDNLTQDLNGKFTSGLVTVTYSGSYGNYTISGALTANVYGDSTDELRAKIKARGYVTYVNELFLSLLILALTGNTINFSQGDYYDFAFSFPHLYGCVDGIVDDMTGDYEFKLYTQGAPLGQVFDKGTASIER